MRDYFRKIILASLYFAFGGEAYSHVGGGLFGRRNSESAEFAFYLLQLAVLAHIALDALEPVCRRFGFFVVLGKVHSDEVCGKGTAMARANDFKF